MRYATHGLVCAIVLSASAIPPAAAAPLRKVSACTYEYTRAGSDRKLKPVSAQPGQCAATVPLVTGDVAIVAVKGADEPQTKIAGVCEKREEEEYKCGPFNLLKCTRDKISTRKVDYDVKMPFTVGVFVGPNEAGALKAGEKKALVAPKDVAIVLAHIDLDQHLRDVQTKIDKLCPPGETRKDLNTQYWFDSYHPQATITTCRPAITAAPGECAEITP